MPFLKRRKFHRKTPRFNQVYFHKILSLRSSLYTDSWLRSSKKRSGFRKIPDKRHYIINRHVYSNQNAIRSTTLMRLLSTFCSTPTKVECTVTYDCYIITLRTDLKTHFKRIERFLGIKPLMLGMICLMLSH